VYGLLFATIVTLFILPTLYYMVERRAEKREAAKQVTLTDDQSLAK
jgi:cobalt-zinc-cadmium resistance protein CzcA